jgi:DnaK suppressor protein
MTPREGAGVEALLAAERRRLHAIEASLAAEHDAVVDASSHANLDDEHDPEGPTVGFERARVASLLRDVRRRLSEVNAAEGRLRAGVYGRCCDCRRPIAGERLAAYPAAVTCHDCAAASPPPPVRRR